MRQRNARGRKKNCSKCGKEIENSRVGKYAYCKSCHAEYMRLNRPKHSELSESARLKSNARSYIHVYIQRGKVEIKGCEICGAPAECHHDDYSKPLEVHWLCRDHHLELHGFPQKSPCVDTPGRL